MNQEERDRLVEEIRTTAIGITVSPELAGMFPVRKEEELMVPTRNGETHVYLYHPFNEKQEQPLPLFVNIHGGGFVKGMREQDIVFSRNIASNMNCRVINIDYTTAPEQKYPYALHQCYDVVKWASDHAEELGIDRLRIAVGGHSAGANATAGISILANQSREFSIKLQILDYAPLDLYTPVEFKPDAYKMTSPGIDRMRFYDSLYCDNDEKLLPTVSPLHAPMEMLTGLPEALIITAGMDCLREEAEKYALKLIQAGVPVTARRFLKSHHGFVVRRIEEFAEAEEMIYSALKKAFAAEVHT